MKDRILLSKLLALITDQVNQELLDAIDYQQEEIRILKGQIRKRIRFTDAQRKNLAEKAKKLGKAIPFPEPAITENEYDNGHVAKKSRLGGLLNFYHRQAA